MIFKVGGQGSAEGTVDGCGNCVPPGGERGTARSDRKRSVACGTGIELKEICERAENEDRGESHSQKS